MKKRICVIFTGGTIGSAANDSTVDLNGKSKRRLLESYRKKYGDELRFDILSPVDMLSENVRKEDLERIAACISGVNTEDYDGIVVTHGTDTLCFTANYFSLIFASIPVPVVLVSSLYPLGDKRSNGEANFAGAVTFIEKSGLHGVFVSFANAGENCKIHLGGRLIDCDQLNGYFRSVYGEHFAEICENGDVIYPLSPHNPPPALVKSKKSEGLPARLCDKIMVIKARSLLDFSLYDFSRVKPLAVVVELYHSGTVCTAGKEHNLLNFAGYCEKCGVPLILAPLDSGANVYASMKNLPASVLTARDMTAEMAVVKVMCALHGGLPADAYFNDDIFFEKLAPEDENRKSR